MNPVQAPRTDGLLIGWMPFSRRSEALARRLDLGLYLLDRPGYRRIWTAPFVYPLMAVRTLWQLGRRRPHRMVVVAPPIVAALVAMPVGRLLGARIALDVHSGALLDRRWSWSMPLLRRLARSADATVVTLPSLAERLALADGQLHVIPTPMPDIRPRPDVPTEADLVVAICGWGADEPIEALIASAVDRPWRLVLTGRARGNHHLPPNVRLSGYLPNEAYLDLVASAAVVVVLTTRDQTLLAGGWEALTLGRPLVISDTPALRATFGGELILVANDADAIGAGIAAAMRDRAAGMATSQRVRDRVWQETEGRLQRLKDALA